MYKEEITLQNGKRIILRNATITAEVAAVQELDARTWPEGYRHYVELFEIDQNSIYAAVTNQGEIVSHVGLERIIQADLGKGMPTWNHSPQGWYKHDSDVGYITGHTVREDFKGLGLSHHMIDYVKKAAAMNGLEWLAVILRLNHPTLGKNSNFWKAHGFHVLGKSEDPEWKAAPNAKDYGGVVYISETKRPEMP